MNNLCSSILKGPQLSDFKCSAPQVLKQNRFSSLTQKVFTVLVWYLKTQFFTDILVPFLHVFLLIYLNENNKQHLLKVFAVQQIGSRNLKERNQIDTYLGIKTMFCRIQEFKRTLPTRIIGKKCDTSYEDTSLLYSSQNKSKIYKNCQFQEELFIPSKNLERKAKVHVLM